MTEMNSFEDTRCIVWFDIDNTLYSASSKISDAMGERIHAYFTSLGLSDSDASQLHLKYYTQYGLALRGLVRHHEVDPLDFDRKCDGSLPLEDILKPDPDVRQLIEDIDRKRVRVWALTNAYINHAQRILKILRLDDQIEGVVYCDYLHPNFVCKPEPEFYHQALIKAGIRDPSKCFFIDDSRKNVEQARNLGWGNCVHFCERGLEVTEGGVRRQIVTEAQNNNETQSDDIITVTNLAELREIWSSLFRSND